MGDSLNSFSPLVGEVVFADLGFCAVVENHREIRVLFDEVIGGFELFLEDEEVVGEVVIGEFGDALVEGWIGEEFFVRCALGDFTDAFDE